MADQIKYGMVKYVFLLNDEQYDNQLRPVNDNMIIQCKKGYNKFIFYDINENEINLNKDILIKINYYS
jgi:hypothetical protein